MSPKKVLAAAGINALIACLCGLAVVALTGYWWFILVGIACLVAGWCYVGGKHPYGYHYLGEIFVFIFFGLVAACGTMFALAGTISTEGMLGGANVGLIAAAVLCVNNLRDVERFLWLFIIFFNNEQYDPYHYQHRSKYLTDTDHHIRKESFRQHPDHIISLRIEYP